VSVVDGWLLLQYIKSFAVLGDDQPQKTEYIRKYLLDAEVTCSHWSFLQLLRNIK